MYEPAWSARANTSLAAGLILLKVYRIWSGGRRTYALLSVIESRGRASRVSRRGWRHLPAGSLDCNENPRTRARRIRIACFLVVSFSLSSRVESSRPPSGSGARPAQKPGHKSAKSWPLCKSLASQTRQTPPYRPRARPERVPSPEPVIVALKLLIVSTRFYRTVFITVTVVNHVIRSAVDIDDFGGLHPLPLHLLELLALEGVLRTRRELRHLPVEAELAQVGALELGQRAERAVHHDGRRALGEDRFFGAVAQLDVHREAVSVPFRAVPQVLRGLERVVVGLEEVLGAAVALHVLVAIVEGHAHVLVVPVVVVVGRAGLGVLGRFHLRLGSAKKNKFRSVHLQKGLNKFRKSSRVLFASSDNNPRIIRNFFHKLIFSR
jgi:hypothetical protein